MATAMQPSTGTELNPLRQMRVTAYDQVTGFLSAIFVLVGFCFFVLLVVWITSQVWFIPQPPPMVALPEPEPGGGGNGAPMMNELDEPVPEEIEQTDEPPPEIVLEAITDLASIQLASVDDLKPAYQGKGPGRGTGDGRGRGPGGDGDADIIPRYERWVIKYASESTEIYARQLDFFKIELGAVGGSSGQVVDYAANFSTQVRRYTGAPEAEKRLYMTWRTGDLQRADKELMDVAGIKTQGRIIMQLYPKETEDLLSVLEDKRSGGKDKRAILKTVFAVKPQGAGFEFVVTDQFYRTFQP